MTAILNFGGACTDDLKIIKTIGDKLKFITDITSQYKCECNQLCIQIIILNTKIKQMYNSIIIFYWQEYRNMMKTYTLLLY